MARLLRLGTAVAGALLALGVAGALASNTPRPAQCASKAPVELPVNAWAPARKQLAPPGAGTIRLCRYNALGTKPPRGLASSALVTNAQTVKTIVAELDELPSLPHTIFCPMDDGAEIDALIAYSDGNGVVVQFGLTGCAIVSNGSVTRTAGSSKAGQALLEEIEKLTGYKGTVF